MNTGDMDKLADCVGMLGETFRQKVTPATIAAYTMGLDDLGIEEIQCATAMAIKGCKFFPTVFELRELAGVLTPDARAEVAWGFVDKAVTGHGYVASVCFDDPATHATIRNLGGWDRFCAMPTEEFDKWLRKEFIKVYTNVCRRGVGAEEGQRLIGWAETKNRAGPSVKADGEKWEPRIVQVKTQLPALPNFAKPKPPEIGGGDTPRIEFKQP